MTTLYPEIEPYDHGMLDVGNGNLVYWEVCGNRKGKPAVVLHGGPGSGCSTNQRRYFDPSSYQVVLFDQRGCGRSLPHASEAGYDLSVNTTVHLLADIERLRKHLGIERWLALGGSWGVTLALAYAERNPHRVSALVLASITMTRRSEIDWLYRGVGPLFPEEYEHFCAGVPVAERDGDLIEAYHRLLIDPDPTVSAKAAKDWCEWESALVSVDPNAKPEPRSLEPRWQLAFARIVTHYFSHDGWLEDGILLQEAGRLASIPGVMIHGRSDVGSRVATAEELARAWPNGELIIVSGAGHSSSDPGMSDRIVEATDRFAKLR
jgi:proline iminopeptidase